MRQRGPESFQEGGEQTARPPGAVTISLGRAPEGACAV